MKIVRNSLYAIRPIWQLDKWYLIFNLLYTLESIPRRLLNILIIKYIVDAATEGAAFSDILCYGLAFLASELLLIILKHSFQHLYKIPREEIIRAKLKKKMMEQSVQFDLACYDDAEFYDLYTKAYSALDNVAFNVLNSLINLLSAMLSVSTLISYMFIVDPVIILVSLLGSSVSIFCNYLISKVAYSQNEQLVLPTRKCAYVQERFFGRDSAKDLRVENLPALLSEYFDVSAREKVNIVKENGKRLSRLKTLFDAPLDISDMFMWLYIAYGIINATFKAGDFMSLSNAVWSLSQQIRNVFNTIPKLSEYSLHTDNIIMFDAYSSDIISGTKHIASSKHTLEIRNVSFSYKEENEILNNVSFCVSSGERIAIVGPNGSGKTTLVKLILRLYDVSDGDILLDGISYNEYDLSELRAQFAVVFQDYHAYAVTIAENVLMHRPRNEEEENQVEAVLEKVGLLSKIRKLKDGIYTKVTKEFDKTGVEFSGGEYQKLALARALIKNAPIVVMDEPSSALDPLMEKELSDIISSCFSDRIVIVISHKLSMTKDSDQILLLQEGQVKEQGTHEKLVEKAGVYCAMWNAQSEKYVR